MKITIILGFSNPFAGAAWTRISSLSKAWSKENDVSILGTFTPKNFQKRGARNIGNYTVFNLIPNMDINNAIFFILIILLSLKIVLIFLLSKKTDIVIVSVPTGSIGVGAILACKLLRKRYVIDYRDRWEDYAISINNQPQKSFYIILKKILITFYRSSTLVVVPPKVVSIFKKIGQNAYLMQNGADVRTFKPINQKNDQKFKLVYVNGPEYYDYNLIFKAIKLVSIDNLELLLIGKMPEAISKKIDSDIRDKIIFLGEISDHNQLSALIAKSDVGLLPLSIDYIQAESAVPTKFFEYCACGLPVIATTAPGSALSELITKNQIGIAVPSMDEKEFAKAIIEIKSDSQFRIESGKRARVLIEEEFDRSKIAEKYLDLLTKISNGKMPNENR